MNSPFELSRANDDLGLEGIVGILRVLADTHRLRILGLLASGEQNVTCIYNHLGIPQATVSHHLALMRMARLVIGRREGKQVIYSLSDLLFTIRDDSTVELNLGQMTLLLDTAKLTLKAVDH